jgi:hypothetical protein
MPCPGIGVHPALIERQTMSLTQHLVTFRNKVRQYSKAQCDFAVRDIHETLRLHGGDMRDPYIEKLWAELDAVRERQHKLA